MLYTNTGYIRKREKPGLLDGQTGKRNRKYKEKLKKYEIPSYTVPQWIDCSLWFERYPDGIYESGRDRR